MAARDLRLDTSYRQILAMALPISLAMLVPQINFITNNIFLGGLGERQLASAGITGVFYLIFAVAGNGLNNGLQALIARRAGQNLHHEIGEVFFHGIWVALGFAFLGIAITTFAAPPLLNSMIRDPLIAEEVISFLRIRIWGLPLLYLYVMRNALLVGTNQTRLLIWGTLAEALTNIALDYALIYGHWGFPALGFNGAAYASIVAEGVGLVVIYVIIHINGIHRDFSLFENIKWRMDMARTIVVRSAPLMAQFILSIATWEYFYLLIEHHGSQALAISNTMRNIFGVVGIFAWAFAATTNTMVSNIIGQGREAEVLPLVRKIMWVSVAFSTIMIMLLNINPGSYLAIYGQGPQFVEAALPVLRIVSMALWMMAVGTVWLNAVTGTGNTVVNLVIEIITLVIYIIYVYVVLEYLNLSIVWGWGSEWVYWISMFSMSLVYMLSGRWRGKKI
ncbi:MAG: MATE family efflux transporter [Cyclobacteriaceae bacterium]|jgi:MATE family multidrug resistance protein|nr:MATE family efflux transporter [Flammeovirgaceae bacterium]